MVTEADWIRSVRTWSRVGEFLGSFRFLYLLRPYRGRVVLMVLVRIVVMCLGMLIPLFTKRLIDTAVGLRDWRAFWEVALGIGLVLSLSLVLVMVMTYLSMYLEQMLTLNLRKALQDKWQKLPVTHFQKWGAGEHLYRTSGDVSNVVNALLRIVPDLLILHLEFAAFLLIAAALNLRLTLCYVLALPVILAVEYLHARRIRPLQRELQDMSGLIGNSVTQYVQGVISAKIFLRERYLSRKYIAELVRIVRVIMRKWRIDLRFMTMGWLCNTVWAWAVVLYGFTLVMRGELSLGALVALKLYLTSLARPTQDLAGLIQAAMVGAVSAERIEETLLAKEEDSTPGAPIPIRPIRSSSHALQFDRVTFGYDRDAVIVREATVDVVRGQMIGITGPSGAGKTTLVSLIARFYEPWSGSIRLEGQDTKGLSLRHLRSALSIVPQETFLINGTVRENIAYGDPAASFDEIVRVAKMADAHQFITAFTNGYNTMLGGQRSVLSGGQRQRIGLARAFLKQSPILILDEGLNSIDEASRLKLLASLRELPGKTILLITHDPVVLRRCDAAVALIEGRIVPLIEDSCRPRESAFLEYLKLKAVYERAPPAAGDAPVRPIAMKGA